MICVSNGAKHYLSLISYLRKGTTGSLTILSIFFFSITDKSLLNHGGASLRCCFFSECFVEKRVILREIEKSQGHVVCTKLHSN